MAAKKKTKPDTETAIVARRLAAARENLGLNQIEVAKLVGGDQGSLSKFETGSRGLSAPVLIRLLQLLARSGVDIHHCLLGTGSQTRDVVLGTEEPALLRELQEVVRRHVGNGNGRNGSHKVERPGKRRDKR